MVIINALHKAKPRLKAIQTWLMFVQRINALHKTKPRLKAFSPNPSGGCRCALTGIIMCCFVMVNYVN